MFVCWICMRVCTFLLFVNMTFWIQVWFYTLYAIVDTFFLSIHSVLMFRFASSMKENSKLTAVQNNSRKDLDADSIYPRTHFWLVAAAGMYSCPVATMFCEKLLTRRDIAENLRASVIWIGLSILCCWNKDENVILLKATKWYFVKLFKVSSSFHSMQSHSLKRNSSQNSFYLLWKLLFKHESFTFFCWKLFSNYFIRFLTFGKGGNLQFPNARAFASFPWCVFGLVWHRTLNEQFRRRITLNIQISLKNLE